MAAFSAFDFVLVCVLLTLQYSLQLDNNRIYNCYLDICNQHSTSCSQGTATCRRCADNTFGPYCNLCLDGYYGNATASKDGCKRCPCPYRKSNGTCVQNVTTLALKCFDCKPGYHGELCDECDEAHYKNLTDGLCRPCNCNGHGNSSLEQQCEPKGGRCLQCFHRTTGKQCEKCIDGFYMLIKNHTRLCAECNCNGNSFPGVAPVCHWESGICRQCTHNTSGVHCEHCAQGYKGDAVMTKNCTISHHRFFGGSLLPSNHVVIALIAALVVIVITLIAVSSFIYWKRRKARDPLGFVTINMNHADEDDYNIAWIDPVTGDPIHHDAVDTDLPVTNGHVELRDEYSDDPMEELQGLDYESRDTDRML